MKKILLIAPHADDEVLGMGGTICWHIDKGDRVVVCFVCRRAYNHRYLKKYIKEEREAASQAKNILGYHQAIFLNFNDELLYEKLQAVIMSFEKTIDRIKPDIVYLPHRGDNNQDHRTVFQAAMVVLRTFAPWKVKEIYSYEVPSSTEQAPGFSEYAFLPNNFIDISPYLQRKLKAFLCYSRETRKFPHPRSAKALEILAERHGVQVGLDAAEAFEVVRIIRK